MSDLPKRPKRLWKCIFYATKRGAHLLGRTQIDEQGNEIPRFSPTREVQTVKALWPFVLELPRRRDSHGILPALDYAEESTNGFYEWGDAPEYDGRGLFYYEGGFSIGTSQSYEGEYDQWYNWSGITRPATQEEHAEWDNEAKEVLDWKGEDDA